MAHLDTVEQHSIGDAHAILNLTADAHRHVGADLAVLANLGSGVHDDIALDLRAARERLRRCSPQRGQVQLQTCRPQESGMTSDLQSQHSALISTDSIPHYTVHGQLQGTASKDDFRPSVTAQCCDQH